MKKKQALFFGAWIAILVILTVVVNKISETPAVTPVVPKEPPINKQLVAKRWADIMKHAAAPPRGVSNPKYSLVEFGDFECPQCGREREAIEASIAKGSVNFYFVHRPFPNLHKNAIFASQAAFIAAQHGKFWPMYDMLYVNQKELEPGFYEEYGNQVGLDGHDLRTSVEKGLFRAKVEESARFCTSIGIRSTPTLLVRNNKTGDLQIVVGREQIDPMLASPPWNPAPPPPPPATTVALHSGQAGPVIPAASQSPDPKLAKGQ